MTSAFTGRRGERPDLAPYAARSEKSRGRRREEVFRDDRPAYERDRDRIIHSAAFRRLEYKTQVFVNHEGDYYRTRLTHTIEVAQIARAAARRLGLNEDLTEALALSHDLGHPPFGHGGETVLNRLMEGCGGFEHNRQSLRVVEKLEERYPGFLGLNLTWEVREGIAKHSGFGEGRGIPEEYRPAEPPTLEAQLIDYADEIAYHNHDVDDGLEAGLLDREGLAGVDLWRRASERAGLAGAAEGAGKAEKCRAVSSMIGLLIDDLVETTDRRLAAAGVTTPEAVRACGGELCGFSEEIGRENRALKEFLYRNLYTHPLVEAMRTKHEGFLARLFEAYIKNPRLIPGGFRRRLADQPHERTVCDYIAGMTDRFAVEEYRRLFEAG